MPPWLLRCCRGRDPPPASASATPRRTSPYRAAWFGWYGPPAGQLAAPWPCADHACSIALCKWRHDAAVRLSSVAHTEKAQRRAGPLLRGARLLRHALADPRGRTALPAAQSDRAAAGVTPCSPTMYREQFIDGCVMLTLSAFMRRDDHEDARRKARQTRCMRPTVPQTKCSEIAATAPSTGNGIGIGILTLKGSRAPCATEYRGFRRPAGIQSLTGLQRPARRWRRRLGVQ